MPHFSTIRNSLATLLVGVIVSVSCAFPVHKAEAVLGVGDDVHDFITEIQTTGTTVWSKIQGVQEKLHISWQDVRKNTLDKLAYALGQAALNQITDNTIRWIQGGFHGSPSFALDMNQLFNDVANMVAGNLAQEIRDLAVCDFNANFKIKLTNSLLLAPSGESEKFAQKAQCPFDLVDVTSCDSQGKNCTRITPGQQAEMFAQHLASKGWGHFEDTLRDAGNEFGVAIITRREYDARTAESQKLQAQKLTQSGGFLDMNYLDDEKCDYPPAFKEARDAGRLSQAEIAAAQNQYCPVATPGRLIGEQLTKVTGIDMDRLGLQDSITKIATAFLQQTTKMAVQGIYKAAQRATGQNDTGLAQAADYNDTITQYDQCTDPDVSADETDQDAIDSLVRANPTIQRISDDLAADQNYYNEMRETLSSLYVVSKNIADYQVLSKSTSTVSALHINQVVEDRASKTIKVYFTTYRERTTDSYPSINTVNLEYAGASGSGTLRDATGIKNESFFTSGTISFDERGTPFEDATTMTGDIRMTLVEDTGKRSNTVVVARTAKGSTVRDYGADEYHLLKSRLSSIGYLMSDGSVDPTQAETLLTKLVAQRDKTAAAQQVLNDHQARYSETVNRIKKEAQIYVLADKSQTAQQDCIRNAVMKEVEASQATLNGTTPTTPTQAPTQQGYPTPGTTTASSGQSSAPQGTPTFETVNASVSDILDNGGMIPVNTGANQTQLTPAQLQQIKDTLDKVGLKTIST